jgi:hypothetical protein
MSVEFVGVAYRNNKTTQNKIAEEGAIPLLVQQLNVPLSEEVQVEVCTHCFYRSLRKSNTAMLSRQFLTSANMVLNLVISGKLFFTIFGI